MHSSEGRRAERKAVPPIHLEGRDFRWHKADIGPDKNGLFTISHVYELNDTHFKTARLEFEYWPDAANLNDTTRLEIIERDVKWA